MVQKLLLLSRCEQHKVNRYIYFPTTVIYDYSTSFNAQMALDAVCFLVASRIVHVGQPCHLLFLCLNEL